MENKKFPLIRNFNKKINLNLHVIPHNIKIMKLLKHLLMGVKRQYFFFTLWFYCLFVILKKKSIKLTTMVFKIKINFFLQK